MRNSRPPAGQAIQISYPSPPAALSKTRRFPRLTDMGQSQPLLRELNPVCSHAFLWRATVTSQYYIKLWNSPPLLTLPFCHLPIPDLSRPKRRSKKAKIAPHPGITVRIDPGRGLRSSFRGILTSAGQGLLAASFPQ
jgi:hypothetical protein